MNPLTQIKNTQKVTKQEIAAGVTDAGSWHARFKHSAYIFAGGLAYQLTEGDLLAVFSQYGEVVDVNLVKDRETGKSRGFAFMAYEDQRSTVLAVDNLSGARVAGRTITVNHVDNYKIKRAEVEGREVSDSEEEEDEEEDDYGAQDAAVLAAQMDGATVEHISSSKAAGAPADDPWASKTSVLAALQEAGPMRAKRPHAEHDADDPMRGMNLGGDDEDPLLSMGAERKAKKAKKEKKEKKEKDKDKKKKQKAKKEQDLPDEAGDDGYVATAVRVDRGATAPSADLNGSSHANGLRRSDAHGDYRQQESREQRDAAPREYRSHDGRGSREQEHRRSREHYDDRHRERRRSGERDSHRDGHRDRDRDMSSDRPRHR